MPEVIRKIVEGGVGKMAQAQASDMALLQKYAPPGAEIAAEEVMIVNAVLAHTRLDRSFEQFSKAYLERFAETLPGKSFLIGHDYSKAPNGRWIDAEVRQAAEGYDLHTKFYVKAGSSIADDIRLGIAKDVSIGFRPDRLICDLCNDDVWEAKSQCPHEPGHEYDGKVATATYGGDASKAEALEGSLVWLGCQPGAQVMGQSSPLYQRKMALAQAAQEDSMELKEALAEIERLKPLAEAGERYKKQAEAYEASLRAEILHDTQVKELAATRDPKAAERAVEFTKTLLGGANCEHLETMQKALKEQVKTLLATGANAEGAGHVPPLGETPPPQKRQPWEPRRMAG